MVKWLELLDNGAESCHKIVSLRLDFLLLELLPFVCKQFSWPLHNFKTA